MAYALLGAAASTPPTAHRAALSGRMGGPPIVTQVTIRQRLIIRVPALGRTFHAPRSVRVKEKRGPHCVTMASLAGAEIMEPDSVDFFIRGGDRIRARLDRSCPALDYYSGFYLLPTDDGQVCSGRDTLRTRVGGECAIDTFRRLVAKH